MSESERTTTAPDVGTMRAPSNPRFDRRIDLSIPSDIRQAIAPFGESTGEDVALVSAFAALICRVGNVSDITLWVHTTGPRPVDQGEGTSGIARIQLSDDPTFRMLVAAVATQFPSPIRSHDTDSVVVQVLSDEDTDIEFDRSAHLRKPVALNFVPRGAVRLTIGRSDIVDLCIEYNTRMLDEHDANRLVGYFTNLLSGLVEAPDSRISELTVLSAAEVAKLKVEWNSTEWDCPDLRLEELFERQAGERPNSAAVVQDGSVITYGDLDRRANILARRLIALGVRTGVRVAVVAERHVESLVAILAVLKAGGAYVPIDPDYPTSRVQFMLDDAGCRVIIQSSRAPLDSSVATGTAAVLDADSLPLPSAVDAGPPPRSGSTRDIAYVIYTSGSTGTPKGVVVTHRSAVNFVADNARRFSPDDRCQQFGSLSFDMSVGELFVTWCAGAALIFPPHPMQSIREVLELAERASSTTINIPATYWHAWAADPSIVVPDTVRSVSFGGEVSMGIDSRLWAERVGIPWTNNYGPTETTIACTIYDGIGQEIESETIPIGRPVANTKLYVLGEHGELLPTGTWGELYISGFGVAVGYLDRSDLTEERFLVDPFANKSGYERMYRSGDRARWLPDGNLEFGGRVDNQVKILGHRIEPGEVEAALLKHPLIEEAVVLTHRHSAGSRLVAFVVAPAADQQSFGREVRNWLRPYLPSHMVPSSIVAVERMPLTNNGKIDRAALELAVPSTGSDLPGDIDSTIGDMWRRACLATDLDLELSFFDLGGDSVTAMALLLAIEEELGVDVPPDVLVEAPSGAAFVAKVRALLEDRARLRSREL
ncbi:non-ribosomal peptide synthetase [Nocardia arizonensis]|uniref:non-ribosomal peptide synthetase n=1 Tax=Nocardia arizonensis TaxID=1141647 RepID=UPI0006D23548|nr:non-ribosomal peptide synthetase [Nocardia arizonensis]